MAVPTDPIGVFDSGVGGLSVASAFHQLFPAESIVYFADTGHFPYGSRSEEEVQGLATAAAELLIEHGAKVIVVACNTASSVALELLRSSFSVPFVGVVPGVKPGSLLSGSARVGVLATAATFQTRVFTELVDQFAEGVDVRCQVCPDLVALVEVGEVDSPNLDRLIRGYLGPLLLEGVDTLVLGCTHYSFLNPVIRRAAGPGVTIIDTAVPVARQVGRVLEATDLLRESRGKGEVSFYISGDTAQFLRVAGRLWPEGARAAMVTAPPDASTGSA